MGKRITKAEKEILALLYGAEAGFAYVDPNEVVDMVERGWVEQNPGMVEDGKLATRLTDAGKAKHESLIKPEKPKEEPAVDTEPEAPAAAPSLFTQLEQEPPAETAQEDDSEEDDGQIELEIEKNVPMPVRTRGRRGSYKYPFKKMEVGDSFHVAATEDRPKPSRTLASTVSTASKKFGKLFRVRSVGEDDPKGAGARVFRIE